jgi:hypothetical protein
MNSWAKVEENSVTRNTILQGKCTKQINMQIRQKSEPLIPKSLFNFSPARMIYKIRQVAWLFS